MKPLLYLPKTVLLTTLAILFISVNNGYCIEDNDIQRIRAYAEGEYRGIAKTLKTLKTGDKDAVFAPGDTNYYMKWQKGLEYEIAGEYPYAIEQYKKASQVGRWEMSSYDVFLPLGRAYLLNNDCQNASKTLKYFIKTVKGEIFGEVNQEWAISEEGKEHLKKKLKFAQWLLSLCENKMSTKGFVDRKDNKLRLYLNDGRVVELRNLTDKECENGASKNDICCYTFWDFFKPVDYYLVFNQYYKGSSFLLVCRKTGKMFIIDELPNLSPDNKRFITVDMEDAFSHDRIQIWKFTSSGISLEWTYKRPEGNFFVAGAKWLDHRSIRITYRIFNGNGDLVSKYFIVRLNTKGWQKFGENGSLK